MYDVMFERDVDVTVACSPIYSAKLTCKWKLTSCIDIRRELLLRSAYRDPLTSSFMA